MHDWQLDEELSQQLWRARREAERSARRARKARRKQRIFSVAVFAVCCFAAFYLLVHVGAALLLH